MRWDPSAPIPCIEAKLVPHESTWVTSLHPVLMASSCDGMGMHRAATLQVLVHARSCQIYKRG